MTGVDREFIKAVPLRVTRVDTLFATSELTFSREVEMKFAVRELVSTPIVDTLFATMELVFTVTEDTDVVWVVDKVLIARIPGIVKFPLALSK
jgi:hypothetical protein